MKARILLSLPGLVIAAMCLTPALRSQETPVAEERLSLQYVSVIRVLDALTSRKVAEDLATADKPVAATVGKTSLHADPVANTLTLSGPPVEVKRFKEQAASLDRKPVQIILSAVVGQWRLLQNGIPGDCAMDRLPLSEVDLANLRVNRNGRWMPSGWTLEKLSLSTALSILEATERMKVLSRPTIFTLNNVPATFSLCGPVRIPQGKLLQPADMSLKVLPMLHENGEIELEIEFAPVPQGQAVPMPAQGKRLPRSILRTEPFKLTIRVPNRGTVCLGGIFLENPDTLPGEAKVQLVELPIFIQPTVVESPELADGVE